MIVYVKTMSRVRRSEPLSLTSSLKPVTPVPPSEVPIRPGRLSLSWSWAQFEKRPDSTSSVRSAVDSGESRRPMPSATTSRTGEMASALIRSAPASATAGMTSMPSTQRTVAVDFATVSDMARTRTTAQKRPSPIESTTRSQSVATRLSSKAASGPIRRCSGDTYRIPGPHEPREVVAGTYDVEVDVLAEVEARVLVRPAEAGHVDVEHDQARSPSAHGLHQPHPVRVGARRDHRDGAPGKAADPVPGEG